MVTNLGMTQRSTASMSDLVAGGIETKSVTIDAAATFAVGQVLKYVSGDDNWIDFVAFNAGDILAIFYDSILNGTAPGVDTPATVIIAGRVNLNALDATAQADANIHAALVENNINAIVGQPN